MPKYVVTVYGDEDGDEPRTFTFDPATLTTRTAEQREAEASYFMALIRAFIQKARNLSDMAAESWARNTRAEERRSQ